MRLRSSSDSTSESILDELEAIDLGLVEIVVERVTVVKFRMDYGSRCKQGTPLPIWTKVHPSSHYSARS
jgi:hypothetical protein